MEAAHEAAIDRTLGWIEREATATRTGTTASPRSTSSAVWSPPDSATTTPYRDPQLHDHVVIANKVRSRGGVGENTGEKWRTIDGRLLYLPPLRRSLRALQRRRPGRGQHPPRLTVEEREVTPASVPSPRSPGSTTASPPCGPPRSLDVKDRTRQLVEEHRQAHGKEPDERTLIHLAQQATLETRPTKATARSLPQLRAAWREAAADIVGADAVADVLIANGAQRAAQRAAQRSSGRGSAQPRQHPHHGLRRRPRPDRRRQCWVDGGVDSGVDVHQVAAEITTTVAEHRSVWGRHHLEAEARRWSTRYALTRGPGRYVPESSCAPITDRAASAESVPITGTEPHADFAPLTRASDGRSIYTQRASDCSLQRRPGRRGPGAVRRADRGHPRRLPQTFDTVLQASTARVNGRLDAGQLALPPASSPTSSRLVVPASDPPEPARRPRCPCSPKRCRHRRAGHRPGPLRTSRAGDE